MARLELSSRTRNDFRKSATKQLRREGGIPATLYGREDESISLAIQAADLARILKSPGGRLAVINLKIEDAKSKKASPTVMIQEMQRNPITLQVLHVDLHHVRMDEPVHARVPISLIGAAPGTRLGGILEHFIRELDLRALPDRIPTHIDVDVSHLDLGQAFHVKELQLPSDVELLHGIPDNVIAICRLPIVRVEEVAVPEEIEGEAEAEAPEEGAKEEAAEES